jgi:hypothetical protein
MLGGIAGEDHETEAIDVAGGREIRLVQLQRLLAGMLLRDANDGDDLRVVLGLSLATCSRAPGLVRSMTSVGAARTAVARQEMRTRIARTVSS